MPSDDSMPFWKHLLRPLVPPGARPWLSYLYWVMPQKAWTAVACALRLPLAQEPAWPRGKRRPFLKALMVAQRYSYGRKEDGDSYEYVHLFSALKKNVGQAEFFDSLGTGEGLGKEQVNQRLEEAVERQKPDLVFIAPFRDELDKKTVRRISENSGAVTVAWFFDDLWRFDIFSRDWGAAVHAIASQDPSSIRRWGKLGHRHQYRVPFGFSPEVFRPMPSPAAYDVTFVGAAHHPGRREAIRYLRARGQPVTCFGSGWADGAGASPEGRGAGHSPEQNGGRFATLSELPRVFGASRINLNFSRVSVPWESRRQLKGRLFEVCGSGGFVLSEHAPGIGELFEVGKEIEVFRTHEEMAGKIGYYLAHEEERKAIAKAGMARALREHTYARRLEDLLEKLQADWPEAPER